jgi:hypothetical protein
LRGTVGILLVVLSLVLGGERTASAGPDPVETEAGDEGGWLARSLRRYFGSDAPPAESMEGRAVEMVDRYTAYAGRKIEVVIISQVARFDHSWELESGTGEQVLKTVTGPFRSLTRDRTIRDFLLIRQGDLVDPFRLADTERLLRSLEFIEDVRLVVVPLAEGDGPVAVVVETRDRWPIGAAATAKDVGRYETSLYSSNILGVGVRFENGLIYRRDRSPRVGYRGLLRRRNLGGTFIDGELEFEDSYRRLEKRAVLDRDLVHPAIRWVGGASWQHTRERDAGPELNEFELRDVWAGKVIPLRERHSAGGTARPLLVPAIRYNRKSYLDRPTVGRDTLRSFHDSENYLAGLTYQRFKYYKTSYLYGMGETENLPAGLVLKLSGGYQDGEYHDRVQVYFESSLVSARNRGDVFLAHLDLGGFYRNRVYEDGSFSVGGGYAAPLWSKGRWRSRLQMFINYDLAINRVTDRALALGNANGLRGLPDNRVEGNQRLLGTFEYRVFPPGAVFGFRFMLLGFVDVGAIAGEKDPLLETRIYASGGLALRVQDPDLVIPALQMRVAFLNSIDDKGVQVGLRIGGADSPEIRVPGTRPGGFVFR